MKTLNFKKKHLFIYIVFFFISALMLINSDVYNQNKTSIYVKFTNDQMKILNSEKNLKDREFKNYNYSLKFDGEYLSTLKTKQYYYKNNFIFVIYNRKNLNASNLQNRFETEIKKKLSKKCNDYFLFKYNKLDKHLIKNLPYIEQEIDEQEELFLKQINFLYSKFNKSYSKNGKYNEQINEILSTLEFLFNEHDQKYIYYIKNIFQDISFLKKKKLIFEKSLSNFIYFPKDNRKYNNNFFQDEDVNFLIKEQKKFNNIFISCSNLNLDSTILENNINYKNKKIFLFFLVHIILIVIITFYKFKFISYR